MVYITPIEKCWVQDPVQNTVGGVCFRGSTYPLLDGSAYRASKRANSSKGTPIDSRPCTVGCLGKPFALPPGFVEPTVAYSQGRKAEFLLAPRARKKGELPVSADFYSRSVLVSRNVMQAAYATLSALVTMVKK